MRYILVLFIIWMTACQGSLPDTSPEVDPAKRLQSLKGDWQLEVSNVKSKGGSEVKVLTETWVGTPLTLENLKLLKRIVCAGDSAFGLMHRDGVRATVYFGKVKVDLAEYKKRHPGKEPATKDAYPFGLTLFQASSNRVDDETIDLYVNGSVIEGGKQAMLDAIKQDGLLLENDAAWIEYLFLQDKGDPDLAVGKVIIPINLN